ncbi:MAG: transposase [Mucilaginibacter sp.]|nr:transposase [Mucilaginibacter sp.]
MESGEEFDFESFKKEALAGLGEGVLAPLLKHLLESALEGEFAHHLSQSKGFWSSNKSGGRNIR